MNIGFRLVLAVACVVAAAESYAAAPTYTVRSVFGDPQNDTGTYSYATSINNKGWVGIVRGMVGGLAWGCSPVQCVQVPVLPGGHGGVVVPTGISKQGVLVGHRPDNAPFWRGWSFADGLYSELQPYTDECPWCFLSSTVRSINEAGLMGGSADGMDVQGTLTYPVLVQPDGTKVRLPTPAWRQAAVYDVNDFGLAVGSALEAGTSIAFVSDGSVTTALGSLGGTHTWAYAVNNKGQVVGCGSTIGSGGTQPFLYQSGVMKPLPMLGGQNGCARDINHKGYIVGVEYQSGAVVPTLHHKGKVFDLRTRLAAADADIWQLEEVNAINARGQIAGSARYRATGARRAVVLSPVVPD